MVFVVAVVSCGCFFSVVVLHVLHGVHEMHTYIGYAEHFSNVYFMFSISNNEQTKNKIKTVRILNSEQK